MKRSFKSLISFFSESWAELKKVRWPNRKELTNYTLVVLGTIVVVAVYFWVLDIGISVITSYSIHYTKLYEPLWFPEQPAKPVRLLPPLALAYIGDAVFEVAVRQHVMAKPNLRPHHFHGQSTKYVFV